MRSVISLKVSKERIVENASVPEIVSSGTYTFCEKLSILIFQAIAIFTRTLQVRDRQLIATGLLEKRVARSDEITSSHPCPTVKM